MSFTVAEQHPYEFFWRIQMMSEESAIIRKRIYSPAITHDT
jgi:hypothetical protein